MRLKQHQKDINTADFDSKVEKFKIVIGFSDTLRGEEKNIFKHFLQDQVGLKHCKLRLGGCENP